MFKLLINEGKNRYIKVVCFVSLALAYEVILSVCA